MTDNLPDRGYLTTEQRLDASSNLDALPTQEMLGLINQEDQTVPLAVARAIPAIAPLVDAVVNAMRQGGRLIYIGAGTSGRLGVLDASECPPTFHCDPSQVVGIIAGGDSALRKSSEGREDDPHGAQPEFERLNVGLHDVVVGIAAGGTTPYVLGALRLAKAAAATTALICCTRLDPPPSHADHLIELIVGPEVLTGSTRMKAGTATKLALNMISTAAMVRLGKVWGNLMVDLRATNAKLRDRAARILATQCSLSRQTSLDLLDKAGGRVKIALVMARLNLDADEAQRRIDAHHGRLRPLLGDPLG